MRSKLGFAFFYASFPLILSGFQFVNTQTLDTERGARVLVSQIIDEGHRVTLHGNTRPEARAKNDRGAVADDFPMEHMLLQLQRPPEIEKALQLFIEELHTPGSPNFHQWINAQEFGARFGPTKQDLDTVAGWLASHGFSVNVVYPSGMVIDGMTIDKLLRAQVAFILFAAAYLAEIVRGGLQAIPRGQYEAADSIGLSYWQRTRLIILPQALALVIPPLVNSFIGAFKNTSLVIIIGLFDLLGTTNAALSDANWRGFYLEAYVFTAAIYWTFCFFMSRYSQMLEREFNKGRRV